MSRTPGTHEIAPWDQAVACRYGTLTHSQTRRGKRSVSESLKCLDDMGSGAWRVPGAVDLGGDFLLGVVIQGVLASSDL